MGTLKKPPRMYMPYITTKQRKHIQESPESVPDGVLARQHMLLIEQVREIRKARRRS